MKHFVLKLIAYFTEKIWICTLGPSGKKKKILANFSKLRDALWRTKWKQRKRCILSIWMVIYKPRWQNMNCFRLYLAMVSLYFDSNVNFLSSFASVCQLSHPLVDFRRWCSKKKNKMIFIKNANNVIRRTLLNLKRCLECLNCFENCIFPLLVANFFEWGLSKRNYLLFHGDFE